jgi:hypothetical protein
MNAVRLARLTTLLVIAVFGLVAGHVIMPYAAGAPIARQVAFWTLMLGIGALRGWREGVVREEPTARWRWRSVIYAFAAVGLALGAYWLVHGSPFGA